MGFFKFAFQTLFNLLVLIFLFFLCIVGLTIWVAPKIAPKLIDTWIEGRTGFSTSIQKIDLKLFSGTLNFENITLINPPYYQNKNFLQIKQILIKTQLFSLWRPQRVLDELVINIDKLTLVRTPENSINILEFANNFRKHSSSSTNDSQYDSQSNSQSKYLIKRLSIQLNSLQIVGFPQPEDTQNFTLNYAQEFTDVTNFEELIQSFITEIVQQSLPIISQELTPIVKPLLTPEIKQAIQKAVETSLPPLKKA